MCPRLHWLAAWLLLFAVHSSHAQDTTPTLQVPQVALTDIAFEVAVTGLPQAPDTVAQVPFVLDVNGTAYDVAAADGAATVVAAVPRRGRVEVQLRQGGAVLVEASTRAIPGWLAIMPPVLAIAIALMFKRVIPALFLGILFGAWTAIAFTPAGLWKGLLATFQVYVLNAFIDEGHASIILFSLMIGGMVGIVSRNGGMQGVVNYIVSWASTAKRGQVATALLGIVVFFDDYANTLVVGNTMRSVTDKLRISREKLAYIVDSTAAPVACIALVTTWIGYEVGLIGTAVEQIDGLNEAPYSIFLNSIAYSFYPILALFFVFVIANTNREFGPMHAAEERARLTGKVLGDGAKVDEAALDSDELKVPEGKPLRAINALLPVAVLVFGVLGGLYVTGVEAAGPDAGLRDIIGGADSYKSLMWASLLSVITAFILTAGQRILTLEETVEAWYSGLKSMMFAMIILMLAWSLSAITEVLHTADYLVSILGDTLPIGLVPTVVFLLAAATAFATGSSWGTMGILMPLVLPLSWAVITGGGTDAAGNMHIIYATASAVLAGAVWGDHCSPISDTTILSSMASGCDHIEHVRTQLPYALSVGGVAIFVGLIPAGYGFPWWLSMILGAAVLVGILWVLGKPVREHAPEEEEAVIA